MSAARRRRLRFVLVFVVVQLVLAVVILEGGLRLARRWHGGLDALLYSPTLRTEYEDATTTRELLERSILGFHPYEARAGFVLSSRGFRTPEVAPEPAAGALRVVVLGDSFTFASGGIPWGWGWPALLERELDRRLEPPVEVINLGVPAVGPRFELRMWELEGARLAPDVVLLAFFVGNDFTDESGTPLGTRRDSALARWSVTWRLVRNLLRLHRERAAGLDAVPSVAPEERKLERGGVERSEYRQRYRDDEPRFSEEVYLEIEEGRLRLVRADHRQIFERLFADTREVLVRLHRSVRARGARFFVVLVPDEFQVSEEVLARIVERYELDPDQLDLTLPQRRLMELCEAEAIACLDLLPVLKTAPERVYRVRDTHWNLAGNRRAARAIGEALAELLEEN